MKKAITLLLAAAMCTSMLASCGGGGESSTASTESSGSTASTESTESGEPASGEGNSLKMEEETEVVFAFFTSGMYTDEGLQMVEDGINEITVPEDNVRIHFEAIPMSNYTNQIGMMMAGGEQLDVLGFMGNYSTMLAKNQLMNLSPYMDTYGQGILEAVGEDFLKSTSNHGDTYAIPTLNGKAAVLKRHPPHRRH